MQNLPHENVFDLRQNEPVRGMHFLMNYLAGRLILTQGKRATLK